MLGTLLLVALLAPAPDDARFEIEVDGKWGFIDRTGKVVIPPQYDSADAFSDGLAKVETGAKQTDSGAWTQGRYGFIDPSGKWVIEPTLDWAHEFSEGRAVVKADRRFGYIDKTGKLVIPATFLRAEEFRDGLAAVEVFNDTWGLIDPTGKPVFGIPEADMRDPTEFRDGLLRLELKGKPRRYRFVDRTGKVVLEPPYDSVRDFRDGRAAVRAGELWGYIDKAGELVIPATYKFTRGFNEGLAAVQVDGKWGFIDRDGKTAIPPTFDEVDGFSEGLARVKIDGKYGYLDKTGKLVIPATWDDGEHALTRFRNGLAIVGQKVDGKLLRGWIDRTGKVVWKPTR